MVLTRRMRPEKSAVHISSLYILIVVFLIFEAPYMELHVRTDNRDWPPIKIYYQHVPEDFNLKLLNQCLPRVFDPTDLEYQFYLEILFPSLLEQTPLLTNDIKKADFIFLDFLSTYAYVSRIDKFARASVGIAFFNYLKDNGLLKYTNMFYMKTHPFDALLNEFVIGYKACFEKINHTNWFVIPYLSNYSQFPPSTVNFSQPRKYSVFLSGSYLAQRKHIFELMENIENSYSMIMSRKNISEMGEMIYQVPFIMSQSKYCIVPRGDSPSSKRFYDAIMYGCIPIIISDGFDLPFDGTQIRWDDCVVKIPQSRVDDLPSVIANITDDEYQFMYQKLIQTRELIRFDNGVSPTNGIGSILWELYYTKKRLGWRTWFIQLFEIFRAEFRTKRVKQGWPDMPI